MAIGIAAISQAQTNEFENTPPGAYASLNPVAGWTVETGVNGLPGIGCGGTTTWSPGSTEFSVVATPVTATPFFGPPNVFSIDNVVVSASPLGGQQVVRLNDNNAIFNGTKVTRITKTFSVTNSNSSCFIAWCGSWESINHTCCDRPVTLLRLFDAQGAAINCFSYNLTPASASCVAGQQGNTVGNVNWLNWQTSAVDLSPLTGSLVTLEIVNADCNGGGHHASVYLDLDFRPMGAPGCPIPMVMEPPSAVSFCSTSTIATIAGPPGYTSYQWIGPPSGSIAASQASLAVVTITNPVANAVYSLNMVNVLGCSFTNTYVLASTQLSITGLATASSCANGSTGAATVVCSGSGSGYNYTWLNASNAAVGSASVISNLPAGVYNLSVTAMGAVGCGSAAISVTIGSQPASAVTIIQPYCGIQAQLLTPAGATAIQWYSGTVAIAAAQGGTASLYTVLSPTTNQVFRLGYSTPQGCRDSVQFILAQAPTGSLAVSSLSSCSSASTGVIGLTLAPSPMAIPAANNFSVLSSPLQYVAGIGNTSLTTYVCGSLTAGVYSVTASDGLCFYSNTVTVNTFSFDYSVSPLSATTCANTNVLASVSFTQPVSPSQYSYLWSPTLHISNGMNTSIAAVINNTNTINLPVSQIYSVTVTPSAIACPLTKTIVVHFVGQPVISPVLPFCAGSPLNVSVSASPAGGNFSSGSPNFISPVGVIVPANVVSGTHTLSYNFSGCGSVTTAVTVSQLNSAALSSSVMTTCFTGSCQSLMGITTNSNGTWAGTGISANGLYCPAPPAGTYSLTYSTPSSPNPTLCPDSRVLLMVVTPPVTPTLTAIGPFCANAAPVQIIANPPSGTFVATPWLTVGGLFTPAAANIGPNNVQYSGYCMSTGNLQVLVDVFIPSSVGQTPTGCVNSATFDLNSIADNPGGIWTGAGVTNNIFNYQIAGVGTTTLVYFTDSPSGYCPSQTSTTIQVLPLPVISVSGNNLICQGQSSTLTASGGVSYTWTGSGVNSPSLIISPASTTIYSVIALSAQNCSDVAQYMVSVSPCTSLDEIAEQKSSFRIFPNPNNGVFTIDVTEQTSLRVFDVTGGLLHSEELQKGSQTKDLRHLANGLYFVQLSGPGAVGVFRLVKAD